MCLLNTEKRSVLVVRFTLQAKKGCIDELVEWAKSWPDYGLSSPPHGWRVYWPSQLSPWNVVFHEIELENLTEHEARWKELWVAPRVGEVLDRLAEISERGGGGEVWQMEVL